MNCNVQNLTRIVMMALVVFLPLSDGKRAEDYSRRHEYVNTTSQEDYAHTTAPVDNAQTKTRDYYANSPWQNLAALAPPFVGLMMELNEQSLLKRNAVDSDIPDRLAFVACFDSGATPKEREIELLASADDFNPGTNASDARKVSTSREYGEALALQQQVQKMAAQRNEMVKRLRPLHANKRSASQSYNQGSHFPPIPYGLALPRNHSKNRRNFYRGGAGGSSRFEDEALVLQHQLRTLLPPRSPTDKSPTASKILGRFGITEFQKLQLIFDLARVPVPSDIPQDQTIDGFCSSRLSPDKFTNGKLSSYQVQTKQGIDYYFVDRLSPAAKRIYDDDDRKIVSNAQIHVIQESELGNYTPLRESVGNEIPLGAILKSKYPNALFYSFQAKNLGIINARVQKTYMMARVVPIKENVMAITTIQLCPYQFGCEYKLGDQTLVLKYGEPFGYCVYPTTE